MWLCHLFEPKHVSNSSFPLAFFPSCPKMNLKHKGTFWTIQYYQNQSNHAIQLIQKYILTTLLTPLLKKKKKSPTNGDPPASSYLPPPRSCGRGWPSRQGAGRRNRAARPRPPGEGSARRMGWRMGWRREWDGMVQRKNNALYMDLYIHIMWLWLFVWEILGDVWWFGEVWIVREISI